MDAKQPSPEDLEDAADIMESMASGHCSMGAVPKDIAEKRLQVAKWLHELAEAQKQTLVKTV